MLCLPNELQLSVSHVHVGTSSLPGDDRQHYLVALVCLTVRH